MDILYLLIPLSAVLVLGIVEREGQRLIAEDPEAFDEGQAYCEAARQESSTRPG